MRRIRTFALILPLAGCISRAAPDRADDGHGSQDALIYAVVIDNAYAHAATERVSILESMGAPQLLPRMPIEHMIAFLTSEAPGLDPELVRAVYRDTVDRGSVRAVLGAHPAVAWINAPSFAEANLDPQHAVVELSPVAYVPNGRQALVYLRVSCGGLCGSENFVVLERPAAGRWRVAKYIKFLSS